MDHRDTLSLLSRYAGRVCGYDRDNDLFIFSICGQTQTLTGPLARGGIDGRWSAWYVKRPSTGATNCCANSALWSSLLMPSAALGAKVRRGVSVRERTWGR